MTHCTRRFRGAIVLARFVPADCLASLSPEEEDLTPNVTDGSAETGIHVFTGDTTGYSAKMSDNTANKNQFGRYSQMPTSGGGNHASGNSIVNCRDVTCVK
jgi:hypothetical protein